MRTRAADVGPPWPVLSQRRGWFARRVENVTIEGVTVRSIGGTGVDMRGLHSGIKDSALFDIGCRAAVVHGGNATMLQPGHMFAINNTIHDFAQYKRTYMSGIHWAGVNNTYSHNTITDAPHNCKALMAPMPVLTRLAINWLLYSLMKYGSMQAC